MRIEHTKNIRIDELAHLVPRKGGATWQSLWQIMYYTRLFKYIHKSQYPKIKKLYNKVCTHEKLQELCKLGYFKNPQQNVYCAKDKVLPILKEAGFKTETLPKESKGIGDVNELNNTEIFIQKIKEPNFHTILYPQFGKPTPYLIPDALIVQLNQDNRQYKLTFLEIESKKPEWEKWINNKLNNYNRLALDIEFYTIWVEYCELLGIPKPNIKNLKFTFKIIQYEEKTNFTKK